MPHDIAQIHCCHWDLGRFKGVCGEGGGGVMRDRFIAESFNGSIRDEYLNNKLLTTTPEPTDLQSLGA